jgi:hypothetical protein
MCDTPHGVLFWYSTCQAFNNVRDQYVNSELLDETNIDDSQTLCGHSIRNQFWQFPLCRGYQLWQPGELH